MMKFYSLLFLIFLHHISAYPGDEDNRHEPVIRLRDPRAAIVKTFPFKDMQSRDHEHDVIKKYFCPAETDEDISKLEIASKNNYKLKYCVLSKTFQTNEERICKKEAKPVLMEMNDEETRSKKCGFNKYHTIHGLAYYECKNILKIFETRDARRKDPTLYKLKFKFLYPYQICYDMLEKSVVWTKHHILMPQLFQNPYFQNQHDLFEPEINTDSYFMDADLFLIIKRRYELENLKDTSKPNTFIMVPRPLVPAEHCALSMIKKTTRHYINMAPLWEKLTPLMNAIDQGIKQAQMNLESSDPELYNYLTIYTTVTATTEVDKTSKTWFNLLLFQGNIWYKFIHRSQTRSAVLIIIHNTPGNPPSNGCLVGKQKECKFETWSKDEEVRKGIISDDTKYAYCCEVVSNDMKGIFSIDYEIDEYLEIDSLIAKSEPIISTE